jgi:transposase
VVLTEDETDLLLFPPLRACWALKGEPAQVPITGYNARRVVFGALNLRTGYRLLMERGRQRAVDFQEFLRMVHWFYRGWHVAMLLDEDSSHTAKTSRQLAEQLQIQLLWLPHRSPHLNPIEHLWRDAKAVICANRQYDNIEQEVDRFMDYIYDVSDHETLQKAGVLSEDFWLKHTLSKNLCGPT